MSVTDHLHRVWPPGAVPAPHLPFADLMDVAMFHPEAGYYGAARVDFGQGGDHDYWTYAARLSPDFGEMIAWRVRDVWLAVRDRVCASGAPFTVVEVGGGEGQLLRDVHAALTALAATDEPARALLGAVRFVAADRSLSLLDSQRGAQHALVVEHLPASAEELAEHLPGPFYGVIIANELLTQMSVDLLRLRPDGWERLEVLPWCRGPLADLTHAGAALDGDFAPLRPDALPDLVLRLATDPDLALAFGHGELVRWTGAWTRATDPEAEAYHAWLAPELRLLAPLDALPATVTLLRPLRTVLRGFARLLSTGAGAFLTVDYGGASRHALDSSSRYPHLRTYGQRPDGDAWGVALDDAFAAPGYQDMTTDLDFGWATHLAREAGLELAFYGHQGAIEVEIDLWEPSRRARLIAACAAEGYVGIEAGQEAWNLVDTFRHGGGYHAWAVATPDLAGVFGALGPSDPVDCPVHVPADLDRAAFTATVAEALTADGVAPDRAVWLAERGAEALHPTGSPFDDLIDVGLYRHRAAFLDALVSARSRRSAPHA